MYETPPIEVHIVNSSPKVLGGTGEVGPVTLVPAVVNAIFARRLVSVTARCR
jgi:CO/xanthine dehydrogenase Mo-binding subunit